MADISIGDIALITAHGTLAGQEILNTFSYRCISLGSSLGTNTQTAMSEFITKIQDTVGGVGDSFLDALPTNYTLVRWSAQVIKPTRYARVNGDVVNTAGAFGAIASTANIAAVITRRGVLANRKNVGSLHLTYPDAATETTAGLISAGYASVLTDLCLQMVNNLTLAPSTLVWSPVLVHRSGTPTYTEITAAFPQSTIRVMRRRTVGLGS